MLNSSVPGGGVKHDNYLERILKARVYDVASETPLELAPGLSRRLRNRLLIKREDLQPIFSFKLRGAYNKMAGLPRSRLARGVIAASAGNHAQGVALAAQRLGCRAVVVMPVTTPRIKVDAVLARGAQVVLHGDSYAEAFAQAMRLKRRRGLAFVHPYDDPEVIAGQGTIGMEILRQHQGPIDAVFVAIGGVPNTDWAADTAIVRDQGGYLVTGPDLLINGKAPASWPLDRAPYYLETSVPGSFAAGDVRHRSIKRVATAAGEGAMAIAFVHRYLEETA